MKVSFDGARRLITILSGEKQVSASIDLYSDWKEWAREPDNLKYPPAFRTIGGELIGGGVQVGAYFFLQNQDGWRIKPPEENIDVTIDGNLYGEDPTRPLFSPTDGPFNTSIRLNISSLTPLVDTSLPVQQTVDRVYSNP